MGGSFTPDSLSREGSPIPENAEEMIAPPTNYIHHPHPQIIPASSIAELCRISQSAPGSPSGKKYRSAGIVLFSWPIAMQVVTLGQK